MGRVQLADSDASDLVAIKGAGAHHFSAHRAKRRQIDVATNAVENQAVLEAARDARAEHRIGHEPYRCRRFNERDERRAEAVQKVAPLHFEDDQDVRIAAAEGTNEAVDGDYGELVKH